MHEVTASLNEDQVSKIVRTEINEALYDLYDSLDARKEGRGMPVFDPDEAEDVYQIQRHIDALLLTFKYVGGVVV